MHVYGRADWSSDLEKITQYADRIGFRGAAIDPKQTSTWLISPQLVSLPNLLDDSQVRNWIDQTRQRWAPLVAKFKQFGFRIVPITVYFLLQGDSTPEWYRQKYPDFYEMPAGGNSYEREAKLREETCLAHPALYEVAERYWKLVGKVMDDPAYIATCVDNEPRLRYRMGRRGLGGNPHTKRLFCSFLRNVMGKLTYSIKSRARTLRVLTMWTSAPITGSCISTPSGSVSGWCMATICAS